jgi:hypothetical protein
MRDWMVLGLSEWFATLRPRCWILIRDFMIHDKVHENQPWQKYHHRRENSTFPPGG